jgi:gluconate 2-dehydrogenase gamma chain
MQVNRRNWCLSVAAWPHVVAALQHAHSLGAAHDAEFQALDPEAAREIDALICQIIPSTDGPGAREAGVIYFIDRALATFASDDLPHYRAGLSEIQQKRKQLFPESKSVASLKGDQQIEVIRSIEHSDFFDLLRTHAVFGFLGNPSYGGNRNKIGWAQIGFDAHISYQHPFGYYDAQHPGDK